MLCSTNYLFKRFPKLLIKFYGFLFFAIFFGKMHSARSLNSEFQRQIYPRYKWSSDTYTVIYSEKYKNSHLRIHQIALSTVNNMMMGRKNLLRFDVAFCD